MRRTFYLAIAVLSASQVLAQPGPAQPLKVPGAIMAAQLLTKIAPAYPPEAKAAHVQGSVTLHAIIGADGTVKSLDAVAGPEELRQAALDAVAQWTYKPYLLDGVAVAVDTSVMVRFTLADATADPRPARAVVDPKPNPSPEVIQVAPEVMARQLITRVNPTYPPDAKARGISGSVTMTAAIARDGTVAHLTVASGPDDLRDAAIEAVRQWVYRPYLRDGQAVAVETTVTLNFTLGG